MKKEEKITVLLLAVLFFGFSVICWVKPADEYSSSERRKLTQFPKMTWDAVSEGKFMTEFEEYTLDQFPLRDGFRNLKAWVSQNLLRKADNNEIYVADGYAVKMEYPLKEESIKNAGMRFRKLYEKYLKDSGIADRGARLTEGEENRKKWAVKATKKRQTRKLMEGSARGEGTLLPHFSIDIL
jgi:hypothetical protein